MSQPRSNFTTNKGTSLPLLNLKGKEYLQVAHRLVWFREEKPAWRIQTEFVRLENDFAIAKASILDDQDNVIATAHKREDRQHFSDYAEKSEAGAIGRALAYIGYGTQFTADELDEGQRIVDSPSNPPNSKQAPASAPTNSDNPGDYVVRVGKKYAGTKLRDIPADDISSFMQWIKTKADAKFRDSDAAKEFLFYADLYLKQPRSQAASDLGFDESWANENFDTAYDAAKGAST
jgi:hypothetical protein